MLWFMVLQRVRHNLKTEQQQHILKTVLSFRKELKIELPYDSTVPLLHIYHSIKNLVTQFKKIHTPQCY